MFKLVPNWKAIATRSHSMWAFYWSLIALLIPEVVYFIFQIDLNPRLFWLVGVGLLIYGIIGRIKDQGIST